MFKRVIMILCICCLTTVLLVSSVLPENLMKAEAGYLSNADVMPKYVTDRNTKLEASDVEGDLMTPDWFKSAIMVEVRLETATKEGTIEAAVKMLDHYQEMGVNCLWITPVYQKGKGKNGYSSFGPQSIDPGLTGTTDYKEGWEVFAWFVEQAHKRNIHILLDFLTWGVDYDSPLLNTNPELFSGQSVWGGAAFDWESPVFLNWYKNTVLNIIDKTNIDGLRCDVEPNYTGYDMYKDIRKQAMSKGQKLVIMGEMENERFGTYDVEQNGVMSYDKWDYAKQYADPKDFYMGWYNIVDSIKTGDCIGSKYSQLMSEGGQYRFYTFCLSNHDFGWTAFHNNLIRVGYQAIFAPFIPLWYMGEEVGQDINNQTLYFSGSLDLSLLNDSKNRNFYETLKKYIRIRRQYPNIFNYFPVNHRDSNICKVDVGGLESLQAYARYDTNGNAIIIVPNPNIQFPNNQMTITIPFAEMGMTRYLSVTVTDLMNGQKISSGSKLQTGIFNAKIAPGEIGVYLVKGSGLIKGTKNPSASNQSDYTNGQDENISSEISSDPTDSQGKTDSSSKSPSSTSPQNGTKDKPESGIETQTFVIVLIIVIAVVLIAAAGFIIFFKKYKPKNN